jgi:hypothetical protein
MIPASQSEKLGVSFLPSLLRAKYRVYLALAFSCHLAVQFNIVLV